MTALPLDDELSAVYARLSGLVPTQEMVQTSLALVAQLAHQTVPGSMGAGLTLVDPAGRPRSSAGTHEHVARFDQLQYDVNDGPCLSAFSARTLVWVDDTRADLRFPRWKPRAQDLGIAAVISAPLVAGNDCVGAIKVYADVPRAFDRRAQQLLPLFASQAASLLANVQEHEKAEHVSDELRDALLSRDAISTAKGILMAQDGLTEQEALRMLMSVATRQRKKLRDVADSVVATVQRRNR